VAGTHSNDNVSSCDRNNQMSMSLSVGPFSLLVPDGWQDVTSLLTTDDCPITIADPVSGVGALQLSLATYRRGAAPAVTLGDLESLLTDFALSRGLTSDHDRSATNDPLLIIGESFRKDTDYIRAWYCSDRSNIALVTYVCEWTARRLENAVVEGIVRSITAGR
jgi:hypothetical protein